MYETILLATFTKQRHLNYVVDLIKNNFRVLNKKIFILKDCEDIYKRIITFNTIKNDFSFSDVIKNTISLHRKKETNTLYTLNALNEIIKEQNEGILDTTFSVDWEEYRNSILLMNNIDGEEELKKINTALIKIIRL